MQKEAQREGEPAQKENDSEAETDSESDSDATSTEDEDEDEDEEDAGEEREDSGDVEESKDGGQDEPNGDADAEEAALDLSKLKGGKVNKAGNVISPDGRPVGRINQGVLKHLVGKGVDENGDIWNDSGKKIGVAELIPDDELEDMMKDPAPFEAFSDAKVDKDGFVTSNGERIGKVVEGDAKKMRGMSVDEDGDILDRAGNQIGRAERWEEEEPEAEPEKLKHGAAGRPVNQQGEVTDEGGNVIAKLTWGETDRCAGKEVDNDGDVVDGKGGTIGHVTMISDIPGEKEEESEEDKEKREQADKDKKLAQQMAYSIQQTLDQIKPICDKITRVSDIATHGGLYLIKSENRGSRATAERRARRGRTRQASPAADRGRRQATL